MNIKNIFAIPHFHFDVEWWHTEKEYAEDAVLIIDRALHLLEKHTEFTFCLDQAYSVKPFIRKYPEKLETIKKLIREKRIEFVGGTLAAPDENIPCGESLVRQFVYGKGWAKETLECDVKVAWEIDEFGHPPQIPQLLKKCGFDYFVFARGVKNFLDPAFPLQFFWQSPDGTKILTHWLAAHYPGFSEAFPGQKTSMESFFTEAGERIQYEGKRSAGENLLFPFGTDFTVPKEEWMEFVKRWNKKEDTKITFSTPRAYFENLQKEKNLKTITTEFNPILTGCYESRVRIKQLCRKTQNEILEAEKLNAISFLLGDAYETEKFDAAWENILVNDFHDIVCGTGTDKVYRNTLKRYEDAQKAISFIRDKSLAYIARRIPKPEREHTLFASPNTPLLVAGMKAQTKYVSGADSLQRTHPDTPQFTAGLGSFIFNSAGWERDEILESPGGKYVFKIKVPPLGYAAHILQEDSGEQSSDINISEDTLENAFYEINIDKKTGWIKSLYDKEKNVEVLDTKQFYGNELIAEEDAGNLWTVQKTGTVYNYRRDRAISEVAESGPLRVILKTSAHHKEFDSIQTITLYSNSRRIDFKTFIIFRGKDRRLKVVFAPNFKGKYFYETPYAVTERGEGHFCAQNFVDIGNDNYGIALINKGTPGYEIKDGILAMTLLRSVSVLSPAVLKVLFRNFKDIRKKVKEAAAYQKRRLNIFEWLLYDYHGFMLKEFASEGGPKSFGGTSVKSHLQPYLRAWKKSLAWEHGAHVFEYSLYPHAGDFKEGSVVRTAYEFNNPLAIFTADSLLKNVQSKLKNSFSFGGVQPENIVLTALKKAITGGDIIARIYETAGKDTEFEFKLFKTVKKCVKTSLDEKEIYEELKIIDGAVRGKIGKWEIATLKLQVY